LLNICTLFNYSDKEQPFSKRLRAYQNPNFHGIHGKGAIQP
jgi:hypothetical protein